MRNGGANPFGFVGLVLPQFRIHRTKNKRNPQGFLQQFLTPHSSFLIIRPCFLINEPIDPTEGKAKL
jgi:hypothetical protein